MTPGAAGPTRLFVYGTLTDEGQLATVTGRAFPRRAATLPGYARHVGRYPYVVPQPGDAVDGFVIEGLDAEALAVLDAYEDEGRLYDRRTVRVVVDGTTLACEVYVGREVASG